MAQILVIADQQEDGQTAFTHALEMAQADQHSIHVVRFIYENLAVFGEQRDTIKQQIIDKVSEALHSQMIAMPSNEIKITTAVVWQKEIYHWIAEYVDQQDVDLVVKTGHRSETYFYTPTDWHLIRECSAPVLIASEKKWRKSNNVLVSVDLETKRKSKQQLNHKLLKYAKQVAAVHGVELFVCYAPPVSKLMQDFGMQYTDEVKDKAIINTKALVNELASQYDIPQEHFIIHAGQPEKAIPSVAAKVNAKLVVIGTSGRTGLSGKMIGNTAEKILALLKTDVLAIKG